MHEEGLLWWSLLCRMIWKGFNAVLGGVVGRWPLKNKDILDCRKVLSPRSLAASVTGGLLSANVPATFLISTWINGNWCWPLWTDESHKWISPAKGNCCNRHFGFKWRQRKNQRLRNYCIRQLLIQPISAEEVFQPLRKKKKKKPDLTSTVETRSYRHSVLSLSQAFNLNAIILIGRI